MRRNRPFRRLAMTALPVLVGTTLALTSAAAGSVAGPPHEVSGPDPLPTATQPNACGSAQGSGPTDRHGWEQETSIAAGSADARRLAIAWIQDWSDAVVVGHSEDGGDHWTESVPPSSICTPGGSTVYDGGALDPWLAADVATDSTPILYLSGLMGSKNGDNAEFVTRSLDNGRTWAAPTILDAESFPSYVDGSQVVVDPHSPGRAYAVWHRGDVTFGERLEYLSTTADGGLSWSEPTPIPVSTMALAERLVVLPDHSVVDVTSTIPDQPAFPLAHCPSGPTVLVASRSTDQGKTWSPAEPISLGDAALLTAPSAAAGPDGSVAIAWSQIDTVTGHTKVLVDRWNPTTGQWGQPTTVSDSPGAPEYGADNATAASNLATQLGAPADPFATSCAVILSSLPIAVSPGGTIAVLYYNHPADPTAPYGRTTDVMLAQSDDGAAWTTTTVAGPFDQASTPSESGASNGPGFLGDYQGLTANGKWFLASYVLASPLAGANFKLKNPPTDVYFSKVLALR